MKYGKLACLLALSLAVVLAACSSSGVFDGAATVQVRLTDAPSEIIASAVVSISSVLLVPADEDGEFEELLAPEEAPKEFDLLDLRNGVEALLAEKPVAGGDYEQLRLIVDEATVTLVEGYTFEGGSTTQTLFVPSGMQTGIKVHLNGTIEAEPDSFTVVVVDFDVDDSFVVQGSPDADDGVKSLSFKPTLVEKGRRVEDF